MPNKVQVPWEVRLGDVGELEIRKRLSYFSIPTKYYKDVGIDFYCELLEEDSPKMPFYVQAKGTEHFDNKWGASIKKSTILYWLLRPSPVFLIVYDENSGGCYWISIEDYRYKLFGKISKTSGNTIYLKMDKSNILETGRDKNAKFIRKIKEDLGSVKLFQGLPVFKGEGYVRLLPDPPRSKIEFLRTKENIRAGLYSLLIYFFFLQRDLENAYLLGEFLTRFDKSHYNHFVWFGQINKALGKKREARKSFETALRICERDPNWPRESMGHIIARIKEEIDSCK
ncbi:MAG: DUF4365 domain-containing protein [Candidatus Bathyarchaeota archaeon]